MVLFEFFWRYLDLHESDARDEDILANVDIVQELASGIDLPAELLQLLDELLSLTRTQTTDELEQTMHVIVIHQDIQINTNFINT